MNDTEHYRILRILAAQGTLTPMDVFEIAEADIDGEILYLENSSKVTRQIKHRIDQLSDGLTALAHAMTYLQTTQRLTRSQLERVK